MSYLDITKINALPQFPFHPDPVGNGVLIASDIVCVCCGVAGGAVHIGNASCDDDLDDITEIAPDTKAEILVAYKFSETDWNDVIDGYQPGGDPAFYKFVRRHCRAVRLEWDCS